MKHITEFNFKGACCANGIIRAKKAVAMVAGAGKVSIDLANHIARVEGDGKPEDIIEALTQANFEVSALENDQVLILSQF